MSERATFEVSYVVGLINIIEKTERERDEARDERDIYKKLVHLHGVLDDGSPVERAERRGYERGVKEAAKVVALQKNKIWEGHVTEAAAYSEACRNVNAAILALLEPVTLQEPEA